MRPSSASRCITDRNDCRPFYVTHMTLVGLPERPCNGFQFAVMLADKNAVPGMSRIDPLAATQTTLKPSNQTKSKTPSRFKVGHVSKPAFLPHLRVSFASKPTENRGLYLAPIDKEAPGNCQFNSPRKISDRFTMTESRSR
jgi:hypothetical protein